MIFLKLKASKQILTLARNPENLETLIHSETLLGALARVLREDWKKSTELATTIVYVFFCFSAFSNFHFSIIEHKVGGLCMQIIGFELQRTSQWQKDLDQKKRFDSKEVYEKYKQKYESAIELGNQLLRVTTYLLLNISEDTKIQMRMRQKGIVKILVETLRQKRGDDVEILVISFLREIFD